MRITCAFRRSIFYPWHADHEEGAFPPPKVRGPYLAELSRIGFRGIELNAGLTGFGTDQRDAAIEVRRELEGAGVPCVALRSARGTGSVVAPSVAAANIRRLRETIQLASWLGAGIVNTTLGTPMTDPGGPGSDRGERISQGSSRLASPGDYERTAAVMREIAGYAADLGVAISIEVHQHTIADNSWSALHLLGLIDRANVGLNPDVGNIYWTYAEPEETPEAAIVALAPHTNYWHCKNVHRVYFPELEHAIYLHAPLPDGELDYRFAIKAMVEAGYDGFLAIEGARRGDHLHKDGRAVAYARALLKELGAFDDSTP
ncbi:MAG: hypothetical protein CL878_08530 [Dehalococcoidia bacterium]|nr:hypothetical protein [Dehalococcoidia bacterium]